MANRSHRDARWRSRLVTAAEPVWICGLFGRRIPHPATGASETDICKCGTPHSDGALLTTSVPGALWHRPTVLIDKRLTPDGRDN